MPDIERNKVQPLWTEDEVAAYLGVAPSTVRTWVKQGKLPVRKVGSLNRFHPVDIEQWTRDNARGPASAEDPAA